MSLARTRPALFAAQPAQSSAPVSADCADVPGGAMNWRRRLAVLCAAIAVPAMAAPGGLTTLPGPAVESTAALATRKAAAAALAFERPGMSFPGSAFYYMADPAGSALVALPTADPLGDGAAEGGRALGELIDVGAAAQPFRSAGVGLAHGRALECLAQAVWYEAASESEAGQRAVAQVVLNRVAHPAWPASVCGVVYQGSERSTGCQFTFTCDGSLTRRPSGASWARALRVAAEALAGRVYAPVGLATHYHTLWVNPYWAASLDHAGTIGAHRFYRLRGVAGTSAAFTMAYSGSESGPVASRSGNAVTPSSISQGLGRPVIAYDLAPADADRPAPRGAPSDADTINSATLPAPAVNGAYREAGQVRPEYARAGEWKAAVATGSTPATNDSSQ